MSNFETNKIEEENEQIESNVVDVNEDEDNSEDEISEKEALIAAKEKLESGEVTPEQAEAIKDYLDTFDVEEDEETPSQKGPYTYKR